MGLELYRFPTQHPDRLGGSASARSSRGNPVEEEVPREDLENGELLPELCSRGSFLDGGKTAYVTLLCASLRQLFTAPRSFLCVFSFFFHALRASVPPSNMALPPKPPQRSRRPPGSGSGYGRPPPSPGPGPGKG